jgi:hypothetical protein
VILGGKAGQENRARGGGSGALPDADRGRLLMLADKSTSPHAGEGPGLVFRYMRPRSPWLRCLRGRRPDDHHDGANPVGYSVHAVRRQCRRRVIRPKSASLTPIPEVNGIARRLSIVRRVPFSRTAPCYAGTERPHRHVEEAAQRRPTFGDVEHQQPLLLRHTLPWCGGGRPPARPRGRWAASRRSGPGSAQSQGAPALRPSGPSQ